MNQKIGWQKWVRNIQTWCESVSPERAADDFSKTIEDVYGALSRFEILHGNNEIERIVDKIVERDAQIHEYLYQEILSKRAHYSEQGVVEIEGWQFIDHFIPNEQGIVFRYLPISWLAYGGKKKCSVKSHQNRQFVYREDFWNRLIELSIKYYLRRLSSPEDNLLPKVPLEYAKLVIVFRSFLISEVREYNHFSPPIGSIINALRYNGLLLKDGAGHLSIESRWEKAEEMGHESADLKVQWSTVSFQ